MREALIDPGMQTDLDLLLAEAARIAPEAFGSAHRLLSPVGAHWRTPARWLRTASPIDGRELAEIPSFDLESAVRAVDDAADEASSWAALRFAERAALVDEALTALASHRDTLVGLLAWEIGKTAAAAGNDVDRCISGARWYLDTPDLFEGRRPLGLVSNVASWNYPFSVLLMNVIVQALAGNAVIAKIPTLGGGIALTTAFAFLRRAGLPVTLVGGRGAELTEALVGHSRIAAVAFVGGRTNGAAVAGRLRASGKRYALEMEGINAYAITGFTDWAGLEKQIRGGFDFGKQRCTAYTRWVVEASLVPRFVDTWVRAVSPLRVGHPFLAGRKVDFGPLISAAKVEELRTRIGEAIVHGAGVLHEHPLDPADFAPGQDRSAYLAPTLLANVTAPSDLYFREPFGPVDVVVAVHDDDALVREANVSRGALVASVATDDPARGEALAARLDAYKVGINRLRSRGDREETFGGTGESWEGAFVGGANLVLAFTEGKTPPDGNQPPGRRGKATEDRATAAV